MRNVVTALVSYAMAIVIVFYCMVTYTTGPRWFTAVSLLFGALVTYCLTDMVCHGLDSAAKTREAQEEEEEEME